MVSPWRLKYDRNFCWAGTKYLAKHASVQRYRFWRSVCMHDYHMIMKQKRCEVRVLCFSICPWRQRKYPVNVHNKRKHWLSLEWNRKLFLDVFRICDSQWVIIQVTSTFCTAVLLNTFCLETSMSRWHHTVFFRNHMMFNAVPAFIKRVLARHFVDDVDSQLMKRGARH